MQNHEPQVEAPKKKPMKINVREVLIMALVFLVVFAAVQFSVQSFRVDGPSMQPSFLEDEFIMVNKLTYRFSDPRRGDVIIFDPPKERVDSNYPFIKRVIGLPGELVEIRHGDIYIDGRLLVEKPVMERPRTMDMDAVRIEKDHYFVMGDNRDNSRDSTEGWTVPRDNIIGRSWMIYWPLSHWGLSPDYSYSLGTVA
jgi:signal peptidase I